MASSTTGEMEFNCQINNDGISRTNSFTFEQTTKAEFQYKATPTLRSIDLGKQSLQKQASMDKYHSLLQKESRRNFNQLESKLVEQQT